MTPEPFRLVALDNEGNEIDIGKISKTSPLKQLEQSTSIDFIKNFSLKQLEQSTVDSAESIDFRKELSFSFELKPTKEFEDYLRYLVYAKWNDAVLSKLHFICTADMYKAPRKDTRGEALLFLLCCLDACQYLNTYLSEYQYLNPLF